MESLLSIDPLELTFHVELRRPSQCTFRLTNKTEGRVAFKVMTTNPQKYCVKPNVGIIPPKSNMDVTVTMRALEEVPADIQCRDKFLIKSIVVRTSDTIERLRTMFDDRGRYVEQRKLTVVHRFLCRPLLVAERNLNQVNRLQERNGIHIFDWLTSGFTIGLLILIFFYLMMKIIPLIWSLTFMLMMLVVKMVHKLVSDSVEDWAAKTLCYATIHFLSILFKRVWNSSDQNIK